MSKYGTKDACSGTFRFPLPGSVYLHPATATYLTRRGIEVKTQHYRAKCPLCKKDCGLRSDGGIRPHVNTPEQRKKRYAARKAAASLAKTDLLALHTELREESG